MWNLNMFLFIYYYNFPERKNELYDPKDLEREEEEDKTIIGKIKSTINRHQLTVTNISFLIYLLGNPTL
jgi:hypothetical protein